MKTTLQTHIDKFRTAIGDNYYSETDIISYLNAAQDELADLLHIEIPVKRTMSTVAYQEEYTVPSVFRKVDEVRVENNVVTPANISKKELERYTTNTRRITGVTYNYWLEGNKLGLYYIPDDAADTSAVYTAVSSTTATSIVIDYDSAFPTYGGAVLIDSEVIYYTYLEHTSTTYTTLNGCTRGAEGTVAATHEVDATVYWRDIEIFGYGYPSKFIDKPNSGTATITSGTALTAGVYIYKLTYYSYALQMESLPYLVGSVTAASTNLATSLTTLPVCTDSDVDYKRIYRTKSGGNIYYYVGEVANATTTYSDTTADSSLSTVHANPYSQIPEDHHKLITWMALRDYFNDREELTLAGVYQGRINGAMPNAIFKEQTRDITEYRQRPLPE